MFGLVFETSVDVTPTSFLLNLRGKLTFEEDKTDVLIFTCKEQKIEKTRSHTNHPTLKAVWRVREWVCV